MERININTAKLGLETMESHEIDSVIVSVEVGSRKPVVVHKAASQVTLLQQPSMKQESRAYVTGTGHSQGSLSGVTVIGHCQGSL